jgi:hypothetical protein
VLATITARAASIPEQGTTMELLRTARERILSTVPGTIRVITVIDDTAGEQASDIPVNLALVFAQAGQPVELLLPGATTRMQGLLRSHLDLTESTRTESSRTDHNRAEPHRNGTNRNGANRSEPTVVLRSAQTPALSVFFPAEARNGTNADPQLSRSVEARLATAQPDILHFLVLRSTAPRSSLLAAGRLGDATVVVAAAGHSTVDRISEIMTEADQLDKLFLGTIIVPAKRSIMLTPEPPARFQPVSIDVPIMRPSLVE